MKRRYDLSVILWACEPDSYKSIIQNKLFGVISPQICWKQFLQTKHKSITVSLQHQNGFRHALLGCWGVFCLKYVIYGFAPDRQSQCCLLAGTSCLLSCKSPTVKWWGEGEVLGLGRGLKARLGFLAFACVTCGISRVGLIVAKSDKRRGSNCSLLGEASRVCYSLAMRFGQFFSLVLYLKNGTVVTIASNLMSLL